MRFTLLASVIFIYLFSSPALTGEPDSVAYKLIVISSPSFSDRKTVEKRYEFILPRFTKSCDDAAEEERVGGMLVAAHNLLKEVGLEKEEKLFNMVKEAHPYAQQVSLPNRCAELFGMYVSSRREGMFSRMPERVLQVL